MSPTSYQTAPPRGPLSLMLKSSHMSMKFFFSFLFFLLSLNTYALSDQKPSDVKLISSHKVITKNSQIDVGFYITIKKGWSTYWKNPGDISQPMKVSWSPSSLKISSLRWPRPQRILYKEWNHFGYKRDVIIMSSVEIPKNNSQKSITLKALVTWLACKNICVPFKKEVSLTLPISEKEVLHPHHSKQFTREKRRLPQPSTLQAHLKKNQIFLKSDEEFRFIDFFPIDSFSTEVPKVDKVSDTSYTLSFSESKKQNPSFTSLIVYKQDQRILSSIVHVKAERQALNLIFFMLLAFAGGFILNFMPCVLPVVFLKFYNTVRSRNLIFSSSLYSVGVISSFMALALIINSFKEILDINVGWGFQMQSPIFIVLMILFFTFIGLSFLDLLYVSKFLKPFKKPSYKWMGEVLSGFLATLSATPCTAPFMGAAIGFAFKQTHLEVFIIFACLGLGMASPYIVLSFFPKMIKKIPHPGKWNKKFKYLLSLPMFGTSIWLIYILAHMSPSSLFPILFSLLLYGFSFWLLKEKLYPKKYAFILIICSTFLAFYPSIFSTSPSSIQVTQNSLKWRNFADLSDWRRKQPVLVNITAKWCLTCHVNEITTFKNKKVIQYLKDNQVITLKGDWTVQNDDILEFLKKYDRAGIPFTVFFPAPNKEPVVLPEILSPNSLINSLESHLQSK